MKRIRVLLVDDQAIVRSGFRREIESCGDIALRGEASSGEEAIDQYDKTKHDVVVMDLSMPGQGGLAATKAILRLNQHAKILVFSFHQDPAIIREAMRLGASGYLSKLEAIDHLPDAIRSVAQGKEYLSAETIALLAKSYNNDKPTERLDELTPQLREVFMQLVDHHNDIHAVAKNMGLKAKTIHNYRKIIIDRLNLETPEDLRPYAKLHGLSS